jgi:hypothetical protein
MIIMIIMIIMMMMIIIIIIIIIIILKSDELVAEKLNPHVMFVLLEMPTFRA